MYKIIFFLSFLLSGQLAYSQNKVDTVFIFYSITLQQLKVTLKQNGSFKNAVLLVESNFTSNKLSVPDYYSNIEALIKLSSVLCKKIPIKNYRSLDTANYKKNLSIYSILKDTIKVNIDSVSTIPLQPFTYNFTDPFGEQDYTNTFVTKLLATHQGNCQSLAYLYKILADELGAKCWLSLAPNHIYIKNYSQKLGWYNTELTSGTFPTDAWMMTTGYVSPEAIKSGLYMDTLSNRQAIALCVLDLAKCYEKQTKNYYDGFILKCCDLVLQYHHVNPMALLMRAETLKKVYLHEKETKFPRPTVTLNEMQKAYITLAKLGYREMSDRMYQKWLKTTTEQKEKYGNKKVEKPLQKK